MDVRISGEYDPLHMPCILKVEPVEPTSVCFHYEHGQIQHTPVQIKEEIIEVEETVVKTEIEFQTSCQHENLETARKEVNNEQSLVLSDDDGFDNTCLEASSSCSDTEPNRDDTSLQVSYNTHNSSLSNTTNSELHVVTRSGSKYKNKSKTKKRDSVMKKIIPNNAEFCCDLCPYKTKNKPYLKCHLKYKHKFVDIYYTCKICQKTFVKKSKLKVHMKMHYPKNESKSLANNVTCKNNKTITNNPSEDNGIKFLHCDLCLFMSTSRFRLTRHLLFKHKLTDKCFVCKICNMMFVRKYSFKRHLKIHGLKSCNKKKIKPTKYKNQTPIQTTDTKYLNLLRNTCNLCSYKTKLKQRLTQHLAKHHNIGFKIMHECTICKIKVARIDSLKRHLQMQHGVNEYITNSIDQCKQIEKHDLLTRGYTIKSDDVKCQICHLPVNYDLLKNHMETLHKDKELKCKYCPEIFYKIAILKNHLSFCHRIDLEEKKIHKNCPNCDKLFDNISVFKYHMKNVCKTIEYSCKLCNNKFKHESELMNHVTETHSNLDLNYSEFNQIFVQKIRVNMTKNNKLAIVKQGKVPCHICKKQVHGCKLENHLKSHYKYFSCDHCYFKTKYKSIIAKHITEAHLNTLKCGICTFIAENSNDLQLHANYVHDGNTLQCKYCNYQAKYKFRIDKHVKYNHDIIKKTKNINKNSPFTCEMCYKSFKQFNKLKIHIKDHVKLQNIEKSSDKNVEKLKKGIQFTCGKCNKVFANKSSKNHHVRRSCKFRERISELNCDLCDYKTRFKNNMRRHFISTHKCVDKYYHCHLCELKFVRTCTLKRHYKIKHENKKLEINCQICELKLQNRKQYKNHVKIEHGQKYICITCCCYFAKKSKLNFHKRIIHSIKIIKKIDPNLRRYVCEICGKSYKTNDHLKRHTTYVHDNHVAEVCDECGKCFQTSNYLQYHKKHYHGSGNVELFKCKFCDKQFKLKNSKVSHELSAHKKIKDNKYKNIFKVEKSDKMASIDPNMIPELTCTLCGKIATSKCNLTKHIYAVHSNLRPFKCGDCDKSFKFRSDLRKHAMTHTDVKPLQCPSCDFTTRYKISLQMHIVNKHVKKT